MSIKHLRSWEKGEFWHAKKGGRLVVLATNFNPAYGDLITKFEIDGVGETPVKSKYSDSVLSFSESNSLCGEREFENGSITFEFLYKPLGLSLEGVKTVGLDGWQKIYTIFHFTRRRMEEKGWKFEKK